MFYPGDARELARAVDRLLADATPATRAPKALIVPHAGYVYSGPIAATAYASLKTRAQEIRRVVLLGPSHRVWFDGLAVPDRATAFATPLGEIPLDAPAIERIRAMQGVIASDEPHANEHSLEVQLPFLQRVLGAFMLVPIAVGEAEPEKTAAVIEALWGGPETLVLVSSDLSHYLDYAAARATDARTAERIAGRGRTVEPHHACGSFPVNALLRVAERRQLRADVLDLRNSGDTAGTRDRVVGYGAFAFFEEARP